MTGVAGVMALVLAEAMAGATAFLWVGPLWSEVKPGFFKLLGAILTVLAVLTWLSVEAGVGLGWWKWVGQEGDVLSLERFGASAPGTTVLEKLGFTTENVVARAQALLRKRQRVG